MDFTHIVKTEPTPEDSTVRRRHLPVQEINASLPKMANTNQTSTLEKSFNLAEADIEKFSKGQDDPNASTHTDLDGHHAARLLANLAQPHAESVGGEDLRDQHGTASAMAADQRNGEHCRNSADMSLSTAETKSTNLRARHASSAPTSLAPSTQPSTKTRGRSYGDESGLPIKRKRALAEDGDFTAAFELGWSVERLTRIWNTAKNRSLPPNQQVPLDKPIDDEKVLDDIEERKRKNRESSRSYTAGLKVKASHGDQHALEVLSGVNRIGRQKRSQSATAKVEPAESEEETSDDNEDVLEEHSSWDSNMPQSQGSAQGAPVNSTSQLPTHVKKLVRLTREHQLAVQRTALSYQTWIANQQTEADLWWQIHRLHQKQIRSGVRQPLGRANIAPDRSPHAQRKQPQATKSRGRKRNQGLLYWGEPTEDDRETRRDGKTPDDAIEVD